MKCGTFRDGHVEYIDGVLDEVATFAMQQHTVECPSCAAHDASVRRALLLFRNMPLIEPSADFAVRLESRLRSVAAVRSSFGARAVYGGLMAAAVVIGVIGVKRVAHHPVAPTYAMAPVVVAGPDLRDSSSQSSTSSPLTGPMLVTSVSAGMPMWSAAMMAQQVSERFAASAFKTVSLRR